MPQQNANPTHPLMPQQAAGHCPPQPQWERAHAGAKHHSHKAEPGVCCILAAGNHICMAARDVLQQLVVNNNLCILKINPCNDWIGPALATIFEPLVRAGAVRIVYGPTAVAQVRPSAAATSCHAAGRAVPAVQLVSACAHRECMPLVTETRSHAMHVLTDVLAASSISSWGTAKIIHSAWSTHDAPASPSHHRHASLASTSQPSRPL